MPRLTIRLAALPRALWSDYRRRAAERAAIAMLSGMSDQTLRDIGLHRGRHPPRRPPRATAGDGPLPFCRCVKPRGEPSLNIGGFQPICA